MIHVVGICLHSSECRSKVDWLGGYRLVGLDGLVGCLIRCSGWLIGWLIWSSKVGCGGWFRDGIPWGIRRSTAAYGLRGHGRKYVVRDRFGDLTLFLTGFSQVAEVKELVVV